MLLPPPPDPRRTDQAWQQVFTARRLHEHDFAQAPAFLKATDFKSATGNLEPRIYCKQDTRESRPQVFKDRNLFILPAKNGRYVIVQGEGYVDIPPVETTHEVYVSKLDFTLDTSLVGSSEMQHLDFAYAASLVRTFLNDDTLVLTIRGRKYTPEFKFRVGSHELQVESVQTEVDAGYEGRNQVVLFEAKAGNTRNTIIRQLYFPFRQWQQHTTKQVLTVFFEKSGDGYSFWEFGFRDALDYNSIYLLRSARFHIHPKLLS